MGQAILQLRNYCAYQERCHSDVYRKAFELGLRGEEIDAVIAELISDNFINEERYASAFAGGKFRMQHWGRRRIIAELHRKQVSAYCIKRGLAQIAEDEYVATLEKLARRKWDSLERENLPRRKQKTWAYLVHKGYEPALIFPLLEKLHGEDD